MIFDKVTINNTIYQVTYNYLPEEREFGFMFAPAKVELLEVFIASGPLAGEQPEDEELLKEIEDKLIELNM